MTDWKIIAYSSLANAVIAFGLSLISFPLFLLGPLVGGFLAAYFSQGYESYSKMDRKDGAVIGVFSGIIGGLILSLLFLLIPGVFNIITGLINTEMGTTTDYVLAGYLIFQFTIIISIVLGAVGGFVGAIYKGN